VLYFDCTHNLYVASLTAIIMKFPILIFTLFEGSYPVREIIIFLLFQNFNWCHGISNGPISEQRYPFALVHDLENSYNRGDPEGLHHIGAL
jgi:hypothetical protein